LPTYAGIAPLDVRRCKKCGWFNEGVCYAGPPYPFDDCDDLDAAGAERIIEDREVMENG